jgi:hypothetical protein
MYVVGYDIKLVDVLLKPFNVKVLKILVAC